MAGNCIESGRTVVSKITSILMTFTEGSEHSMAEIARRTGLPISTAHRLMTEMTARQLLEKTPSGRYRAGLPLRMIGASPPSIAECAPRVLEDLSETTKCRARIGILAETNVAYIEKAPGSTPSTSFALSARLPVHATALGRALLAFASAEDVERTIGRGLRQFTPHTVTSPERFRRAIALIRLTRVAVVRGELEVGVCGAAMPVFGPDGHVVAAVELVMGTVDQNLQSRLTALAIATRSLSRELGGDPRCINPFPNDVDHSAGANRNATARFAGVQTGARDQWKIGAGARAAAG